MKIKPLFKKVVVEATSAEEVRASGIVIPDTVSKERPQQGKVLAVGPGKKDEPMTVKVDDVVLFKTYSPTEVKVDGKEYLILDEEDILGVLSK
ncbi:co-chaperone GroES [Candidatus Peregrinibacteria bacterium]|nr:co-chaperone GroES [Candidatus Peregrinibacteria bacterium]